MNQLKHPHFIKLKHCIASCTNALQLKTLSEAVQRYNAFNTDGHELITMYNQRLTLFERWALDNATRKEWERNHWVCMEGGNGYYSNK